ncbi:PAB-dependent poly(A)-specific ribonuclease subunit 3 [Tulasnella sp. JGI-2019a]|nr:PAB-dependent poly(A)-specific ribonuclease subunit 3 [Tulasnella sp. JGI-2019a]
MAAYSSQHLGYHLYNQQPRPSGSSGASNQLFISDNIRRELQQKFEDLWRQAITMRVPQWSHMEVRIEAFRFNFEAALDTIDDWSRLRHPNVITVKEAFTTGDFGDWSLVFVSDYHPKAQSPYQIHLASR